MTSRQCLHEIKHAQKSCALDSTSLKHNKQGSQDFNNNQRINLICILSIPSLNKYNK